MSIAELKLLVFDVDGVLTDGSLHVGPSGEETKVFHARDGAAVKWLLRAGLECAFLTGRVSPGALLRRAEELGVRRVVGGARRKEPALRELAAELGLPLEQVGYVGDDLVDLPAMRAAGWSACPADAAPEVRAAAAHVASLAGGRGAAREIIELVLKEQGRWSGIVARYGL